MDRGLLDNLKDILQERISFSESVRNNHAKGEDAYDPVLPRAVLFPKNNEELSKILRICNEFKVPVTAYGTGTSLEGHVVGNDEGFTISMENFNKVISINEADFDCRVQANVSREQLNETLKDKGVFFPIDPGANASLGGMAACSASGTMAVRYGTMRTSVLGLTVVMANGDIIKTGSRAKKTSAGYNLTNLFVGSEGTLGIITEVHLRLSPIPESIMSAVCQFPDLDSAVLTAQEIIQYGVPIARVELLNKDQMDISIKYSKLENLESLPTLFYEFHGSEISNKESIDIVEEIAKNNNGSEFKWAETELRDTGLRAPMVGHVGDGNFHVSVVYDPSKENEYKYIRAFSNKLIDKALEMDGTITGEHGIGLQKKEYLLKQHPDNIPLMKLIKKSFDPNNILNPGKVFDV